MYRYVTDLIENGNEQKFINNFEMIVNNYKQVLINPQVIPIIVKHNLFFNNLKLFECLNDTRFVFLLLNRIYKYDSKYVISNLFSMLKFFDYETFYYYFIAFCKDKNIDIKEILKYIDDNKIMLNNNELLETLKEDFAYKYLNDYLDIFINNSASLLDLKKLFEKYSFYNDKLELLLQKMDSNPNLIGNEIINKVVSLDKIKGDIIVDFINIIIKELLEYGNLDYHNIRYLNEGAFSTAYQIGDKVLKMGIRRETFNLRNCKYFLQPLYRAEIMDKDNVDFLFTIEITEYVDTTNIGYENTYQMYKKLRDEGFVWTDCKEANIGRLLKDNKVYFDGIDKVDNNSTGYINDNEEVLKAGELVVIDNDYVFEEEEFFKNRNLYDDPPSDYFYEFEERYQREKRKTK